MASRPSALLPAIVLLVASLALLATAPTGGDFWWSDAPRHALNGVFVRDLVAAHPFHDPARWAIQYYLSRPALTILFYPPLFYAVEAVAFAIFGVSHFVAQASVTIFTGILAAATYNLARFWLPRWSATGAALLTIGMPVIALWGRQVMLDIPAYALIASSACFLAAYIQDSRPRAIYLAALFLLGGIYTKYNAGFVAPALAVGFIAARGKSAWRDRHAWIALGLTVVLAVPAGVMMAKFGTANLKAVAGLAETIPIASLANWLFYVRALPEQLGVAGVVVGAAGLVVLLGMAVTDRDRRGLHVLLLAWLVFGYLAFSLISVKEPRHSMMVLLPLAIAAPLALWRLLPKPAGEWAGFVLGLGTLGYSLLFCPVPHVAGYRQIAAYVARTVPKNGVVVFSGYRDANFIFDLAAIPGRPDIAVVRADKLLFSDPAGERRRGVTEADYTPDQIAAMFRDLGAAVFVVQPGFWDDLTIMRRFGAVMDGPDYAKVGHFDLTGNLSSHDGTKGVDILRPTYEVKPGTRRLDLDMPLAGQHFEGSVR